MKLAQGGGFTALQGNMHDITVRGNLQGYFPDPINGILVVFLQNVPRAVAYFRGMGVIVVTGSRYLIVFIGDPAEERACISDKVKGWTNSVEVMYGV